MLREVICSYFKKGFLEMFIKSGHVGGDFLMSNRNAKYLTCNELMISSYKMVFYINGL